MAKCAPGCSCRRHTAPHPKLTKPRKDTVVIDVQRLRELAPLLSQQEIARELGTTRKVIARRMAENGIPARPLGTHHAARHKRIRRTRGKASSYTCAHCGGKASDWAEIHDPAHSTEWEDHMPLCRRCHLKYDYEARWGPAPLAKWRASAGPAIAAAWTPQRRAAVAASARAARLAKPSARDPGTGKFLQQPEPASN